MTDKLTSKDSFLAPYEAIKFILRNKKIWHYIIIPIIINVIIFVTLGGFAYWFLFDQLSEWFAFSDAWYISALLTMLQALAGIVVFFVVIALITITANIFAAPFNEILSHRTEEIIKGKKIKEKGHILKSIGQEIIIFILFLIVQIFLFLLNFIPGIGTLLYLIINIILISYLYCFQYLDYTMDRHKIPFFQRWKIIFKMPIPSFCFGAASGIGMVIPLVNMFYIPVCVVAGTMLYAQYKLN